MLTASFSFHPAGFTAGLLPIPSAMRFPSGRRCAAPPDPDQTLPAWALPPSEAPQDDRVVRIRQHGGFSNLPDLVCRHACACCRKELACRPATCERSELPLEAGTAGKAHQKRGEPQVHPFLRYCASQTGLHGCGSFCGIAPQNLALVFATNWARRPLTIEPFCHEPQPQTAAKIRHLPRSTVADRRLNGIWRLPRKFAHPLNLSFFVSILPRTSGVNHEVGA